MEVSQQSQNNQAAKQSQRIVKEENRINSCCHLSSDTFSLAISSTFNVDYKQQFLKFTFLKYFHIL